MTEAAATAQTVSPWHGPWAGPVSTAGLQALWPFGVAAGGTEVGCMEARGEHPMTCGPQRGSAATGHSFQTQDRFPAGAPAVPKLGALHFSGCKLTGMCGGNLDLVLMTF